MLIDIVTTIVAVAALVFIYRYREGFKAIGLMLLIAFDLDWLLTLKKSRR